ncbi:heme peroxidase [Flagelloscypha sp. PMI_526]|nr:heme peroxidase [Flagelloscypha sp. PMI_526]
MKTGLVAILSLVSVVIAGKADCGKGRKAGDKRCCVWYKVLDDVQEELFDHGKCDEVAHDSLRLVFHDAIGWSKDLKAKGVFPGGGADGSLIKFKDKELKYPDNNGLDEIVEASQPIADKHGVSYGDFIQFAGAVSVRNCQGGPKIPFKAGRPDAVEKTPKKGLLPSAGDSVDAILERMKDGGFSPEELVALLASHSIAVQEHVDPTVENTPFDTTPQVLDSQFYLETLLKGTMWAGEPKVPGESKTAIPGTFRLQSDGLIARDPRTACEWQNFIVNELDMQSKFRDAMYKLSLVGQKEKDLYDCSDVIPDTIPYTPRLPKMPKGKTLRDIDYSCPNLNSVLENSKLPTIGLPAKIPPFTLGKHRLHKNRMF